MKNQQIEMKRKEKKTEQQQSKKKIAKSKRHIGR